MFIVFEGIEGSGKTTQIALLAEKLRLIGHEIVLSREPGATAIGKQIRQLLLHSDEKIDPRAEALLFAADRAHHVATVIRPALDAGKIVILDRYIDSSLAYQGAGRKLSVDEVRMLSMWATEELWPDITFVLDLPAEEGLARARGRSAADRIESESIDFHERVRETYLRLVRAEPERRLVLDATGQVADIADRIHRLVSGRLRVAAAWL